MALLWQRNDPDIPISQGDLLVVAWGKTIEPNSPGTLGSQPQRGARDAYDVMLWPQTGDLLEYWSRTNYGLAVVVAHDCAIDKDLNRLITSFSELGLPEATVQDRAENEADPFVAVAEAWPVSVLPEHQRQDAANGALGFVPCTITELIPEEVLPYAVDLNRISTISWRSIETRLGVATIESKNTLQIALCKFFAARNVTVTAQLNEIFKRHVRSVEPLTPPKRGSSKVRVRITFEDSATIDVEVDLRRIEANGDEPPRRRGLWTRRQTS